MGYKVFVVHPFVNNKLMMGDTEGLQYIRKLAIDNLKKLDIYAKMDIQFDIINPIDEEPVLQKDDNHFDLETYKRDIDYIANSVGIIIIDDFIPYDRRVAIIDFMLSKYDFGNIYHYTLPEGVLSLEAIDD